MTSRALLAAAALAAPLRAAAWHAPCGWTPCSSSFSLRRRPPTACIPLTGPFWEALREEADAEAAALGLSVEEVSFAGGKLAVLASGGGIGTSRGGAAREPGAPRRVAVFLKSFFLLVDRRLRQC